ncbi:MAG: adenosylmethionine--8-amino-7-oxononanoate transaminase [Deltaproteobacteria bacterium]|nr:adenosylmethionine--8-amino-7-oxononanoate transaminase [Deltaproteobacteria bacterium]
MKNYKVKDKLTKDWLAFDRRSVWHPYASVSNPLHAYPVASAQGVRLTLEDGRELVDGMASWWAVIHGYNHPVLNEALENQLRDMAHVMFGGLTHRSAVDLAALLIDVTPKPLDRIFFADSGSVAVEVAIKMALQYWHATGRPQKHKLLTIRRGYHGDTFGAMAVCDPEGGMHRIFTHVLAEHYFADAPTCRKDEDWKDEEIAGFRGLIETNRDEIAAVILEPLVQGAGGMRIYCPEYLRQVRALCDEHDVLLILDEIATGFGRTGTLFACEQADIAPDIMCVGKALTGGYLSLAATLTTSEVAMGICAGEPGVFMHGPTFMGNPLACAVARASVELLLESPYKERVAAIETHFKEALEPCAALRNVVDVRALGAVGVVELDKPVDMGWIQEELVKRGVWVRPFLNLVYLMPPYIIEQPDLQLLTDAVTEVVRLAGR